MDIAGVTITDNIKSTAPKQPGNLRKNLLDDMLSRKAAYAKGVKKHRLSEEEMDYLLSNDRVIRVEYVKWLKNKGVPQRTAYRKYLKECQKCLELCLRHNVDMVNIPGFPEELPARFIFVDRKEYVLFLGTVRDKSRPMRKGEDFSIKEAADKLGITPRHVRRLASNGALTRFGHNGIFPASIVYWALNNRRKAAYKVEKAFRYALKALDFLNVMERILGEDETRLVDWAALEKTFQEMKKGMKG